MTAVVGAGPKFRNADGTLTSYALACGYVEKAEGPVHGVWLWHEGACYHVRRHHNPDHAGEAGYIRLSWWAFDTLTEARRHFKKEQRRVRRGCSKIHIQEGMR